MTLLASRNRLHVDCRRANMHSLAQAISCVSVMPQVIHCFIIGQVFNPVLIPGRQTLTRLCHIPRRLFATSSEVYTAHFIRQAQTQCCLHSLFYQKSIEISDGKLRGKFDYVQAQKLLDKVLGHRLWSPILRSVCVPPVNFNNQPP